MPARRADAPLLLCVIAGALNAGGVVTVGAVVSHVTGHWTNLGVFVTRHEGALAGRSAACLVAFLVGSAVASLLIESRGESGWRRALIRALVVETVLVALFALGGSTALAAGHDTALVAYLAFTLAFQNATLSRLTEGKIRSTHMTGITTDLGVELGQLLVLFRRRRGEHSPDGGRPRRGLLRELWGELLGLRGSVEYAKANLHAFVVASFCMGGFLGAFFFLRWSFLGALPLAAALAAIVGYEVWALRRETRLAAADGAIVFEVLPASRPGPAPAALPLERAGSSRLARPDSSGSIEASAPGDAAASRPL